MYQFSLEYFKKIFIQSIMYKQEGVKQTITERVKFLVSHKTIFIFLIDINILKSKGIVTDDEFSLFVKGLQSDNNEKPENPNKTFFSEFHWESLLYFENKFLYLNICTNTKNHLPEIKTAFEKITNLKELFDSEIYREVL